MNKNVVYEVTPNPDCKSCHGEGWVEGDWVDYGSTRVQLPADFCDCVLEQLPEDFDGIVNFIKETDE